MKTKNSKSNAGKDYEEAEYNYIFFSMIRSISPLHICRALGRKNEGVILSAFRRICKDASAYDDAKIYELKPCTGRPYLHINGPASFFIYQQYIMREKSLVLISKQTGIPVSVIATHIKENKLQKDF